MPASITPVTITKASPLHTIKHPTYGLARDIQDAYAWPERHVRCICNPGLAESGEAEGWRGEHAGGRPVLEECSGEPVEKSASMLCNSHYRAGIAQ